MIINKVKKIIPKRLWNLLGPLYHFAWGLLANAVYRSPSSKLIVIGVTGTTGKTTVVYLIAKMLNAAGFKTGFTSTAMFGDGEKEWTNDKKMTMIGRFFTYRLLAKMVKNGCRFAVVETTSEGIVQYRHRFINYDTVMITGLYPEHIESHGSFEKYKEAKGMLFAHLKDCRTKYVDQHYRVQRVEAGLKKLALNRVRKNIIVNGDDDHADYFKSFWSEAKWQFRRIENAIDVKPHPTEDKDHNFHEVVATNVVSAIDGSNFAVCQGGLCHEDKLHVNLLGDFNVTNALAAVTVGLSLGLSIDEIKRGLCSVSGVPGRLERLEHRGNFQVIIDYAFEPNAVNKLYETLELLPHNKVIHVLGSAGGGRDVSRRPVLGRIAGEKADVVIVTNEDPYDDDPQIIIDQVALGAEKSGKILTQNLFKIIDRRAAIAQALSMAESNDIVLITGKGNEQAICLHDGLKIPWDDRLVAKEELTKLTGR